MTRVHSEVGGSVDVPVDTNGNGNGGEGPYPENEGALPIHTKQIGLWAFLATATMLFAGFSSAYIARRAGADWQPIRMPPVLWFNTVVLIASSVTMEIARRQLKRWATEALQRWLLITAGLGLVFLVGQYIAWRQLQAQGIYLPTNPHSSFFYLLTAVHAIHLFGGLVALIVVFLRARRGVYTPYHPGVGLAATYWHFVDIVWIYLFGLLFYLG